MGIVFQLLVNPRMPDGMCSIEVERGLTVYTDNFGMTLLMVRPYLVD